MGREEKTILTNMCMVYDDCGNVLVEDRRNPEWPGITFPGGHIEHGESFVGSVIREVKEETGAGHCASDPLRHQAVVCGRRCPLCGVVFQDQSFLRHHPVLRGGRGLLAAQSEAGALQADRGNERNAGDF